MIWIRSVSYTHLDVYKRQVFDLYSGTGTIAQILAPVAKKVVGVEIVEEAVRSAQVNARLNGLENCEFLAGEMCIRDSFNITKGQKVFKIIYEHKHQHVVLGILLLHRGRQKIILGIIVNHGLGQDFITRMASHIF